MSDTIWNAKTTKSTHSPLGDTARSIMKDTKLCYWSSYPSLRSVLHCFHVCQNLICLSSVTFSSQFSFRRLCRSHQAKIQLPLLLSHGPMLTLKMLWLSVYTFLCCGMSFIWQHTSSLESEWLPKVTLERQVRFWQTRKQWGSERVGKRT